MPEVRRLAWPTVAAAAGLALLSAVTAAAATLGGVAAQELGAARAHTRAVTGVSLDWTPLPSGTGWAAAGVTLTTNPGESFLEGDLIKLGIGRDGRNACELAATLDRAGTSLSFDGSSFSGPCQRVPFDELTSIAVSITGHGRASTFTGRLGEVRGTLASFAGTVVDPTRSLRAESVTGTIGGVSHVTGLLVDLTAAGLSPAQLVGTRVRVRLDDPDSSTAFEYSGTISQQATEPVRVTSGSGTAAARITIDPVALADRAGTARVRTADVTRFSVILYAPQQLGAGTPDGPGRYAVSTVAGTVDHPAGSSPATALDPVGLDPRLTYQYPASTNFDGNTLAFCHNFTVTNTSREPVNWTLTFDTSLAPLWGLNPTASGAFSSAWGWETVSYDPASRLWTIRGLSWNRTLQPGATIGSLGYCAQNVPVPPVDPATFSPRLEVLPKSNQNSVHLRLTVTSTSQWNVPWQFTVDLADHVCAAGLQGAQLQWNPGIEVVGLGGTRYTLRGRSGANLRFVALSRPITLDPVLVYSPTGGQYLPCGTAAQPAVERPAAIPETVAEALPSPEAEPEPSATAVQPDRSQADQPDASSPEPSLPSVADDPASALPQARQTAAAATPVPVITASTSTDG